MNINFHYEQPVPWNGGIHTLIGEKLFEHYRRQFPDIKFTKVNLRETDTTIRICKEIIDFKKIL